MWRRPLRRYRRDCDFADCNADACDFSDDCGDSSDSNDAVDSDEIYYNADGGCSSDRGWPFCCLQKTTVNPIAMIKLIANPIAMIKLIANPIVVTENG